MVGDREWRGRRDPQSIPSLAQRDSSRKEQVNNDPQLGSQGRTYTNTHTLTWLRRRNCLSYRQNVNSLLDEWHAVWRLGCIKGIETFCMTHTPADYLSSCTHRHTDIHSRWHRGRDVRASPQLLWVYLHLEHRLEYPPSTPPAPSLSIITIPGHFTAPILPLCHQNPSVKGLLC